MSPFNHSYRDPLGPNEALVILKRSTQSPLYDGLAEGIRLKAGTCGFTFLEEGNAESHAPGHSFKLRHSIILDEGDQVESLVDKHRRSLDRFDSISLGTIYSSRNAMAAARPTVDKLKDRLGDRVNFLRPDAVCPTTGVHYVSKQKIVDNAVCDSVRIKYVPRRIPGDIRKLVAEMAPFFKSCSRVYSQHHLYHRSPTDGFFALRCADGFLITATKTDKVEMDLERVSLVHGYEETTNTISFSGPFLPSSDVVEAAITLAGNPKFDALIHTHASALFTRNPDYSHRRLVPKLPYGEPLLGHHVASVIGNHLDSFIIMEDHGEVFCSRLVGDLARPAALLDFIGSIASESES